MDIQDIRKENLRRLIGDQKLIAFSTSYGLDSSYLSQMLNNHRGFGEKAARKMEGQLGLPAGSLDLPDSQEQAATIPAHTSPVTYKHVSELNQDDYVFINRYDVRLSAGNGNAQWIIREKDPLSFRASWFKKKGLHPEACKALYVRGRSMEPKLEDWDTVLIDTLDTELIDGEIYAVTYKGQFYIKTLERQGDGILLKSENPEHQSIVVPEEELGRLQVLGRKVWRGG